MRRALGWILGSLLGTTMYYMLLVALAVTQAGWHGMLPRLDLPFAHMAARGEGLLPWGLWPFLVIWIATGLLPQRWLPWGAALASMVLLAATMVAVGVSV